jgi:hypothetical protein
LDKGFPEFGVDAVAHPLRLAIVGEKAREDCAKANHGRHHADEDDGLD